MEVTIHNAEADRPKMIPAVSTVRAKEIPGDIFRRDICGYRLAKISGNIENMTPNIKIDAAMDQNSLIFGQRDERIMRITPIAGTNTAINGLNEKNISMTSPLICCFQESGATTGSNTLVTITALIIPRTIIPAAIITVGTSIPFGGSVAEEIISLPFGGDKYTFSRTRKK
jgi:hypothetical protein